MLFKLTALKYKVPIGLANYALCLKNGRGVKFDENLSCEYYY